MQVGAETAAQTGTGPDLIGILVKLSNLIKAASIMQTEALNLITQEHCPVPL